MDYRRIWHQDGTYFFTVNCLQRKHNTLLVENIQTLRDAVKHQVLLEELKNITE